MVFSFGTIIPTVTKVPAEYGFFFTSTSTKRPTPVTMIKYEVSECWRSTRDPVRSLTTNASFAKRKEFLSALKVFLCKLRILGIKQESWNRGPV